MDAASLRETADSIRDKLGSGVVLLAANENDKISFVVTVTQDCREHGLHAGKIAKAFAAKIGGSGGGKESFAQGGGKAGLNFKEVLESFPSQLAETL